MRRLLSHTEISAALDCQGKWDFSYGGRLAGSSLRARAPHVKLRAGRAWGRAVATFHQAPASDPILARYYVALSAMHASLSEDAQAMRAHLVYDPIEHHDLGQRIADVLWHYAQTAAPLSIADPEFEVIVPIPSRTGRGVSNRYAFQAFLDGLAHEEGRLWIVEYKLRDRLTDLEQLARNRQVRRYAWAVERHIGHPVAGVIVDERLSEAPKPARWVKGKKKTDPPQVPSHAKDQLTTPELYAEACEQGGVDVDPDTLASLGARRWQSRHRVIFRRSEIEQAGQELVSAARLIAQLDSGVLFPVRNPDPRRCPGCAFKEVCTHPEDRELIDLSFERTVPKRDREPLMEVSAA